MILGEQKNLTLEKSLPRKQQDFHNLCICQSWHLKQILSRGPFCVCRMITTDSDSSSCLLYTEKRILKCPGNGILVGFHGRSTFCLEIMLCNPREPRVVGTGRKFSASELPLAQDYNINSSLNLHSASMSPSFGLASFHNHVIQFHKINQWISYTLYMLLISCWGLTRISLMSIFLDFIIQLFQPLPITQFQSHFHILRYLL